MSVILVLNEKGGVGKTTTAVTVAAGLARADREVLIVDLDTQGNVSSSLGIEKKSVLFEWLINGAKLQDVAFNARPHLDVIRSDKSAAMMKVALTGMQFREQVLKKALSGYESLWDDVVIDASPSFDILHAAAMIAADWLIIPTAMNQFSVDGLIEVIGSLTSIREAVPSAKCEIAGIMPVMYEKVTRESLDQLKALTNAFKGMVWPVIPLDTNVKEAAREGKTLYEWPRCKALAGYEACVESLIKII